MKLLGVTGWKNSGKTALTVALVAVFRGRGLTVSTVKHAHHAALLDQPGTDSDRHAQAGAQEVMLATASGWSLTSRSAAELDALLSRMAPVDLVLVEGFKTAAIPKIACWRQGMCDVPDDWEGLIAIATDGPDRIGDWPHLDLDAPQDIAAFVAAELDL